MNFKGQQSLIFFTSITRVKIPMVSITNVLISVGLGKGGSFFLFHVITYNCDGGLQKQVGRRNFSVFFSLGWKKKRCGKQETGSRRNFFHFLSSIFDFDLCIADFSFRPRFFPSEGKKRTNLILERQVGDHMLLPVKKKLSPFGLGIYWRIRNTRSSVETTTRT